MSDQTQYVIHVTVDDDTPESVRKAIYTLQIHPEADVKLRGEQFARFNDLNAFERLHFPRGKLAARHVWATLLNNYGDHPYHHASFDVRHLLDGRQRDELLAPLSIQEKQSQLARHYCWVITVESLKQCAQVIVDEKKLTKRESDLLLAWVGQL